MADYWTPCRHIDYGEDLGDPRYGVMFDDFDSTQETLVAAGFMGGGYTWRGIVESMIRRSHAGFVNDISYDPEGSMFCARSSNLDALKCVAECIRSAVADSSILQSALDNADKSIIE